MKKLIFILPFFVSCSVENDAYIEEVEPKSQTQELWVCHHPGTRFHGRECVEQTFPKGCYVPGDNSKFCWLMTRDEDCPAPENSPWRPLCEN